jgi:hypothetical protein
VAADTLAKFEAFRVRRDPPLTRSDALRILLNRALDTEFASGGNGALDAQEATPGEKEGRWFACRFPNGASTAEMKVLNEAFRLAMEHGLERGSTEYFEFLDKVLRSA